MIKFLENFLKSFTNDKRDLLAYKNILISFTFKAGSVIIVFLLVPITIEYLNPTKYGIWLTISSVIGFAGIFDLGLGNGLRNKLSESLALKDFEAAKSYVSTAYFIISGLILMIFLLFIGINNFLDWPLILNTDIEYNKELSLLAIIVFTFFSLKFVLKLIGIVLTSDQFPMYNYIFDFFGNLIALVFILIISKNSSESLIYIGLAYGSSPIIIFSIASLYFYNSKYKFLSPSIHYFNTKYIKPLSSLGLNFFILQLTAILFISVDNIIISQILGPKEVTPYNIAFRYFSILMMIFALIISPFRTLFTDSLTRGDYFWIRKNIKKLLSFWIIIIFLALIMYFMADNFYSFWIGDKVKIPKIVSLGFLFYVIIFTYDCIITDFINSAGKLKISIFTAVIALASNIPLSIYFAKNLEMGSFGVILATCISFLPGTIFLSIQSYKIAHNTQSGIWNK